MNINLNPVNLKIQPSPLPVDLRIHLFPNQISLLFGNFYAGDSCLSGSVGFDRLPSNNEKGQE